MFFSSSSAYPVSPFRNTYMPLQDITMNQTHLNNGSRKTPAPGLDTTTAISTRGRTMKDYEDQLDALQKENFQLKLRVYFLEEKVGMGTADDAGMKKNIELKMEVEALKKELMEKQELLCQAAKAFELHEEQKEITSRCQAQYEQSLQQERLRISELEQELEEYKQNYAMDAAIENKAKVHQLEEIVESLESEVRQLTASLDEERAWGQELEAERDQYKELSTVAEKRKKQIDQLRASVKSRDDALTDANNRYRTLLSQMENNHRYRQSPPSSPSHSREIKQLTRELEERDRECKKYEEAKKQLILKLCNVQQTAEKTENDLQALKAEHKKALKMIQGFIARQSRLEEATATSSQQNDVKIEPTDDDTDDTDDNLQQRFEEMEARINNLRQQKQRQLQIQTQNLQKLVNTELWSKNKEIAKLQRQTLMTVSMKEIGIQVQAVADGVREQSDSETFSEPDRSVSQARIGLLQLPIIANQPRFALSDSEDSIEHVPCHKTFATNLDEKLQSLFESRIIESMAGEMILTLNIEKDALCAKIKNLEEENKSILRELDRTTLAHSQILVENTKLTNEKQRLERNCPTSCSPDLGIESDASARPLKDTLKITESMTNLLSDVETTSDGGNCLEEVEILKKENEALKKRLIKTRRALEDTFEHLSASNKNKKNVEKAITKQLSITKSILKKTKTFEDT